MKHLTDCSWIAGRDADGCTCAERIFLASCTEEEASAFATCNPHLRRVDVAATWWTRQLPA